MAFEKLHRTWLPALTGFSLTLAAACVSAPPAQPAADEIEPVPAEEEKTVVKPI